ncbi:MAG TPA: ADOP family duplicated permease [Bryobacteraceae bacterium]|jgi:predicted permease
MRHFLLKFFRRRNLEADIEAELAFHREMSGAPGNVPFGNATLIKEQAFDLWKFTTFENLWRDVVYGVRGLRKHPSLVLTALLSLTLGIGMNTALFSLGVEFLLSEPSVTDGQSLVHIRYDGNSHADPHRFATTRDSNVFAGIAGENEETLVNWNNGQETRPVYAAITTQNFFTLLGVPVAIGRGYAETDSKQVAVLNHRFWMKHFGGDPGVVGRAITLDGRPYTVVGVLPEKLRTLIGFGFSPDIFLPSFLDNAYLDMYARLKPGMNLAQAKAAGQAIANRIAESATVNNKVGHLEAEVDAIAGFERLGGQMMVQMEAFFALLLALAGLVLLIACANVASLLLARASTRTRELAVRLSLGASRARLMQQLLIESLMLSVAGALGGLAVAQLANVALARTTLPTPFPIHLTAETDWRVALYAALLSIVAALACGLLPAWQAVRESFAHDSRSTGKMFLRRAIVVGQVAVSVVVLSTGFLFVRNLLRSSALSPGFEVHHTVLAQVNLPPGSYKDPKRIAAYAERAVTDLAALPGVEAAAAARSVPFIESSMEIADLRFMGVKNPVRALFHVNAVTAGFFKALSIPLVAGRTFEASDTKTAERAVIVNTFFARHYLQRQPPAAVGQTFLRGSGPTVYRIVGVAADTKNMTIGEDPSAQFYEYLPSIDDARGKIDFVVKSAVPPVSQLKAVNDRLRQVEPDAGIDTQTLFSSIGFAFLPSQIGAAVLGSMGLLGLLLAMIGLYGTMVYSVARRTQEIGVRMAIGAPRGSIQKLILADAGRIVAIGSAIGIVVALVATRPLAAFLIEGLPPNDPVTFIAVIGVFAATAALASWGPARRATAIDPMSCLRHD